jgi:NAD(P)-dependent dehydrogenase (short-subunit alcohol dehydrogenase family)
VRGLADKVVVIAGGATGIGADSARRLCDEGAKVVVGDINEVDGRATVDAIVAGGGTAHFVAFDMADEASVRLLMESAAERFGGIDALFSNAADLRPEIVLADSDVVDVDLAVWHRTIAVNLTGFFYAARHAIPHLLARGGGAILVTSSADAFAGAAERPAYASSKAGLGALVRHIATRWGKDGIRANAVAPGPVLSEVFEANATTEMIDGFLAQLRLGRLGRPPDIASMVAFLLSDEGSWVTGQVVSVDGGMVVR